MPNILIANLIRLKTKVPQHAFVLQCSGISVPGMRIYAGAIQPPMRRSGHRWFPTIHASPERTREIWEAAKTEYPDLIGPLESTRRFLELDDYTLRRLNLIAEAAGEETV